MSQLELDCLESWKQWCPDFEFKLWNESNFPVEFSVFTQEAYRLSYHAFVSDVSRIWALYHQGGIYLDTDMLLLGTLDDLLSKEFFIGKHLPGQVGVGILGSVKGHPFLARCLEFYEKSPFEPNNLILIPDLFGSILKEKDYTDIVFFEPDFFYPLPFSKRGQDFLPFITPNTLAVHMWNHSWKNEFDYLKEHRFLKSFSLLAKHLVMYPSTYFNKVFLIRFAILSKVMIKQFLYFKLKGNRVEG